MYSRSYKEGVARLPEGYSGTAFTEPEVTEEPSAEEVTETAREGDAVDVGGSPLSLGGLPLSGLFGSLFGGTGLHLPRIGTEEILIIAAAAFLFFTEGGDRECALMLLLLLFV